MVESNAGTLFSLQQEGKFRLAHVSLLLRLMDSLENSHGSVCSFHS